MIKQKLTITITKMISITRISLGALHHLYQAMMQHTFISRDVGNSLKMADCWYTYLYCNCTQQTNVTTLQAHEVTNKQFAAQNSV